MLVVSCLQRNLGDVDSINHIVVSCKPCKVRDVEAGVFSTGMYVLLFAALLLATLYNTLL